MRRLFMVILGLGGVAGLSVGLIFGLRPGPGDRALAASGCYDIDGDGIVHLIDSVIVSGYFGEDVPPAPPQVDMNKDGAVNLFQDILPPLTALETATSCQGSPLSKTTTPGGALAVDADGESTHASDSAQIKRDALVGAPLHVTVHITNNPAIVGAQMRLHWDEALLDANPNMTDANVWSANDPPNSSNASQQVLGPADDGSGSDAYVELAMFPRLTPPNGESTYLGPIVQFEFTCEAKGTANLTLTDAGTHTMLATRPATEYAPTLANAQINCVNTLPPTPTPTPTPTATPTPTPTPKPAMPGPKLQFVVKSPLCAPNGAACTLYVGSDETLTVSVVLAEIDLPDYDGDTTAGYLGFQARLDLSGGLGIADRPGTSEVIWPACVPGVSIAVESGGSAGCTLLAGQPESSYLGTLLEVDFTCVNYGSFPVDLVPSGTGLIDEQGNPALSDKPDTLVINCIAPDPSLDSDNDGCNDAEELGYIPDEGGRRNLNNFWDFYDPNRDRTIDLFYDIFSVAYRFGATDDTNHDGNPDTPINRNSDPLNTSIPPAPAYHPRFDRSAPLPGMDVWDMRAADGTIDLFTDIFGVAFQFGHRCAGPA